MLEISRLKILLPVTLLLTGIACAWAIIATRPQMQAKTRMPTCRWLPSFKSNRKRYGSLFIPKVSSCHAMKSI
jgi:hypothetical protein